MKKCVLSERQRRYLPVKRALDVTVSGAGIVILSPLLAGICLAVKLDSRGPILFKQKRVGKNKELFEIWKFRTMRIDTPKDVPTHLLGDPDQYITKVGRFLRKTSLDELPQIFNIFSGKMSVIGPRPALWNQYDLIAERDRYGANALTPGLTGWAQINGRDELEIPVKARLDGEYVQRMSFGFDVKCFLGTIRSVLKSEGVVEGGTGEMRKEQKIAKKRKICVITTISKTMDWFLVDAMRYLHEKGYEVTLISNMPEDFIERNSDFAACISLPMSRGLSVNGMIKSTGQMYRIFRREKFDLIQYSTPNAALIASLAGILAGVKVRLYCQWGLRYMSERGVKRMLLKALEKMTCRMSTCVEPDSFGNLKLGRKEKLFSKKKSHVVGHGSAAGVDLSRFDIEKKAQWRAQIRNQYGIAEDDFVYGFVGRIDRDKGFNELMEAFRSMTEKKKHAVLLFVGMKDKTDSVNQELYLWSEQAKEVIYTDIVFDPQRYIAAMDCLVLPSYREGFGSVVIEAGVMGVPVIASDIPGPQESIRDGYTGYLVKAKSTEDLLHAMNHVYEKKEENEKLGRQAYEYVRKKYDSVRLYECIWKDREALLKEVEKH